MDYGKKPLAMHCSVSAAVAERASEELVRATGIAMSAGERAGQPLRFGE